MKLRRTILLSFLLILSLLSMIFSQKRPFPQSMEYSHCMLPNIDPTNMAYYVSDYYKYWKGANLREAGSTTGGYYIYTQGTSGPNTVTVSEAHGYGMIAFALMAGTGSYADKDAKKYFDGMYDFFKDHVSRYSNYLMTWAIQTNGSGGEIKTSGGTATDGDLDIAYALVLAHYQWGSQGRINYLGEAKNVINAIKAYEMNPNNKRVMICDNTDWASHPSREISRCSDWMTGHFQTYYEVTNDSFWKSAATTIYSMYSSLSSSYSPNTGLVPDFINGSSPSPYSYAGITHYSYDACRFPWRIATDFIHNNNSSAKSVCAKIANWVIGEADGDPWNIKAEYQLNGTPVNDFTSTAFMSPFFCACSAVSTTASQTLMDKGWNIIKTEKEEYYEDSVNLLCMLLLSGNWWKPEPYTNISDKVINAITKVKFSIEQVLKNSLTVSYSLPKAGIVKLGIYSSNGKLIQSVNNGFQNSGALTMTIALENNTISNGIYFGKLTVDGAKHTTKFSLVK